MSKTKEEIAAYNKAWRLAHADHLKAYRLEHSEERAAYNRAWRSENPDYGNEWQKAHRKQRCESTRKYRENHPEIVAAYRKHYCETHREERNAAFRKWESTHAHVMAEHNRTRQGKLRGADGLFTRKEWNNLLERTGNRCVCCGATEKITADHIIPISKGGSNRIDNIQPLCGSCNSRKGTKDTNYLREDWEK